MYTHTHQYTVCFTDNPPSYTRTHIYIDIYSVSPPRVQYLFTAQIAHHHAYVYIYALFHHTELTSVLPHRWPSFTTLEKPTIWMVTYLSPSYTPICTRVHTYTVCFTDSPPSYIYINIYIYTLFHHTKFCICFTTQIDHHHVYTYIVCFTTQSWHMFYHTDDPVLPHWGSQQSGWWLIYHHPINPYAHTYTHIYCLFYRYPTIIHIYIYCFTTQSWASALPHR